MLWRDSELESSVDFILDIGSHSLKLYRREHGAQLVETVTWDPSGEKRNASSISQLYRVLQTARERHPRARFKAVGTQLMRQDKELASLVRNCCHSHGVDFEVISQEVEAELIRQAVDIGETHPRMSIINVGGRSTQMILPSSAIELLDFGIVDLNEKFNLIDSPGGRDRSGCLDFLASRLPSETGEFVYTGGEATYLRHFGVPLNEGFCGRAEFSRFAEKLAAYSIDSLMEVSPFDPKWMKGAIASNCIVEALLEKSRSARFLPSDLNIGHGIASTIR